LIAASSATTSTHLALVDVFTSSAFVVESVAAFALAVPRTGVVHTDAAMTTRVEMFLALIAVNAGIVLLDEALWTITFVGPNCVDAQVLTIVVLCLAFVDINADFVFHGETLRAMAFEAAIRISTLSRCWAVVQVRRTFIDINALGAGLIDAVAFVADASVAGHVVDALAVCARVGHDRTVVDDVTGFVVPNSRRAEFFESRGSLVWAGTAFDGLILLKRPVAPSGSVPTAAALIETHSLGGRGLLCLQTHSGTFCGVANVFTSIFAFCHVFIWFESWVTFAPIPTIFVHTLAVLTQI